MADGGRYAWSRCERAGDSLCHLSDKPVVWPDERVPGPAVTQIVCRLTPLALYPVGIRGPALNNPSTTKDADRTNPLRLVLMR